MRGGSQGVKNKHIRLIDGKPLMYFTIRQAIKSNIFDNIVISTDSKKLLKIAKSYGAEGWFLRPKKLALNTSPKVPAIKHAFVQAEKFYNKKFETIIELDATSPLRKTEDILKAYNFFVKKKADMLITGCKSRKNPYYNMVEVIKGKIKKVKSLKKDIYRRQDAPETYDCNASIYIWNRKSLINFKSFFTKKTVFYQMPENRSVDIDSELDFQLVKFLLRKNNAK
jgi:CMP-N,N'-diacetyllegionaminic acid synthase|tara:strand:+ start:2142 stop:2816 length:675 start_codon:yes stop_codon:yes gene_type:complete